MDVRVRMARSGWGGRLEQGLLREGGEGGEGLMGGSDGCGAEDALWAGRLQGKQGTKIRRTEEARVDVRVRMQEGSVIGKLYRRCRKGGA